MLEKDKVIKHCNLFINFWGFLDCKKEISQTQYKHDIAWPYCAILIVLISVKESNFNMHSKIVQEVQRQYRFVCCFIQYETNCGNCYALVSSEQWTMSKLCYQYCNLDCTCNQPLCGIISIVCLTHWTNTVYVQV